MNKLLAMFLLFVSGQMVIAFILVVESTTPINVLGWTAYIIVWILAIKFLFDEYFVVRKRKEAKQ
jgi:hypothetical protein